MAKSAPKKPQPAKRAAQPTKPVRGTVGKTTTSGKAAKPVKSTKTAARAVVQKKATKPAPARKPVPAKVQSKAKVAPAAAKGRRSAVVKAKPVAPVRKPVVAKAKPTKPIVIVKPLSRAKAPVVTKPAAAAKVPPVPAVGARPIVEPVAASEPVVAKPKKNGSGLGVRDLQHFADLLLEKRREIVGDMHSMEGEALRSGTNGLSTLPVHMADMGTDNYEQEFTLGLVEKDRTLLREINHALAKIPAGTYGICEGTGASIGKPRLEVQPWARHSIEYARLRERNGRGVRMF